MNAKLKSSLLKFAISTWFFPFILLVLVIILSALQINGSSIGIYHDVFYGDTKQDENLLLNKPRAVRSDEWLVTTQLSLSQANSGLQATNPNLGDGSDLTLIVDAPYFDSSQLFKPHNIGFFFLPQGVAFSLKWWLIGYLLIVSVYFFILTILPGRKWFAIILSLSFVATPFIQWWYQYITLAPIYYALFGVIVAIKIFHSKSRRQTILWSLLLSYVIVSFAVILYPPFQLACALAAIAFLIGYLIDTRDAIKRPWKEISLSVIGAIFITSAICVFIFLPKLDALSSIVNTAYPGNRIVASGGYDPIDLVSGHTNILLQSDSRANTLDHNQSESSNFLLISLLFIPVLLYIAVRYGRKTPNFYSITLSISITAIFVAWMTIPNLPILGELLLLERIPHRRLIVGIGLLNLFLFILTVAALQNKKYIPRAAATVYAACTGVVYLALNLHLVQLQPDFIGYKWAILLAMPLAVILYLVLTKRFLLSAIVLLAFSLASSLQIHPVYRGVDIVTESPLSEAIQKVGQASERRWVSEGIMFENMPLINNQKSMSGVYTYPQLSLWKALGEEDEAVYNRYSHVHFQFDNDAGSKINPSILQPSGDQMIPSLEPCDTFLRKSNVGFILTWQKFTSDSAPCATLEDTVSFPKYTVYIYSLKF